MGELMNSTKHINMGRGELTTSFATYFTNAFDGPVILEEITLCAGVDSRTATVAIVAKGGVADDGAGTTFNCIADAVALAEGEPYSIPLNMVLEQGETIQAKASGADVLFRASGYVEYVR